MSTARSIHPYCRDAYLLARFGGPGDVRPDGRLWEQAVSQGMWIPGLVRRQHAGTLGIFGRSGRSGAPHELDGVAHGAQDGIWLEAKARAALDKTDVAVFAFKCMDLFREAAADDPERVARSTWWPILVSSEPCSESVHRSCAAMGVALCEPSVLPVPALMSVAAKATADMHLDEVLLSEMVRLGERTCRPMQARWKIDAVAREIKMSLDELAAGEIGDLLFIQRELSDAVLDYFDQHLPGKLERDGAALGDRLLPRARTW